MDHLEKKLLENHYHFSKETREKILHYLDLMQHWNRIYNLTHIEGPEKMFLLHILDSLSIGAYLNGHSILDVGTGAGLPGIPLALAHPDKTFFLLDSQQKKIRFLTQVKIELKLSHVELVPKRVEDFHSAQTFDSILSRAFSPLKEMLLKTAHLFGETSQCLAMKGVYPKQELQDVPAEFQVLGVHKLTIKGLDAERHLVCLKKEGPWPKPSRSSTKKAE